MEKIYLVIEKLKIHIYGKQVIDKDESSLFEEEFIEDIFLDKDQDFNDFKTYINKSKNNNVVFLNLSGDTILVVPIPKIKIFQI